MLFIFRLKNINICVIDIMYNYRWLNLIRNNGSLVLFWKIFWFIYKEKLTMGYKLHFLLVFIFISLSFSKDNIILEFCLIWIRSSSYLLRLCEFNWLGNKKLSFKVDAKSIYIYNVSCFYFRRLSKCLTIRAITCILSFFYQF